MCSICEDLGFTWEHERFYVIENHQQHSDYQYRRKRCLCHQGEMWYNHTYNVDWEMAIRVNRFVSKYIGIQKSKCYDRLATGKELSIEYISEGRREYLIDEERYDEH